VRSVPGLPNDESEKNMRTKRWFRLLPLAVGLASLPIACISVTVHSERRESAGQTPGSPKTDTTPASVAQQPAQAESIAGIPIDSLLAAELVESRPKTRVAVPLKVECLAPTPCVGETSELTLRVLNRSEKVGALYGANVTGKGVRQLSDPVRAMSRAKIGDSPPAGTVPIFAPGWYQVLGFRVKSESKLPAWSRLFAPGPPDEGEAVMHTMILLPAQACTSKLAVEFQEPGKVKLRATVYYRAWDWDSLLHHAFMYSLDDTIGHALTEEQLRRRIANYQGVAVARAGFRTRAFYEGLLCSATELSPHVRGPKPAQARAGSSISRPFYPPAFPWNEIVRLKLLKMTDEDQKLRMEIMPVALARKKNILKLLWLSWRGQAIDRANTAELRRIVHEYGWPGRSLVGDEASDDAWLLLQHADKDTAFQQECFRLMRAAKPGDVAPDNLAYLTDRILVNAGKKQLYGTQCKQEDTLMILSPVEDSVNLDKRRAEVGLPPIGVYMAVTRALMRRFQQMTK